MPWFCRKVSSAAMRPVNKIFHGQQKLGMSLDFINDRRPVLPKQALGVFAGLFQDVRVVQGQVAPAFKEARAFQKGAFAGLPRPADEYHFSIDIFDLLRLNISVNIFDHFIISIANYSGVFYDRQ